LVVGEDEMADVAGRIIGPFGAEDDGAALEGHAVSAFTWPLAIMRRTGMGRLSSMVSPGFQVRLRVA